MAAGKKYPDDLRQKIVAEYVEGVTTRKLAANYGVPSATIAKWAAAAGVVRSNGSAEVLDERAGHWDYDKFGIGRWVWDVLPVERKTPA